MELEQKHDYQSSVDTSRPFRSVKEAVAVFGERILVGSAYVSPARDTNSCKEQTTPMRKNDNIAEALKKVEAELEETKAELKILKEREQETEAAVAARERELRKRMGKKSTLAQILSLGENESVSRSEGFGMRWSLNMNNNKKFKPIVPLIGDFFPWKKRSTANSLHRSFYNSPSTQLYL